MNSTATKLLILLALLLVLPLRAWADGDAVSASATIRIMVFIAPASDFNPRLDSAQSAAGSTANCVKRLEDTGLRTGAMDPDDERLARNFFCRTEAGQYTVAEQRNQILLTTTPV